MRQCDSANQLLLSRPGFVSVLELVQLFAARPHSTLALATGLTPDMLQMVPVLTAKAADVLNLYLAEGIRYSTQPTSSAAIITAISHFRLSGGNMTFSNYTTNDGELQFQGAMHFLEDPPQLSLLTSQGGDSSSGSTLQSALTVYSRSLNAVRSSRHGLRSHGLVSVEP